MTKLSRRSRMAIGVAAPVAVLAAVLPGTATAAANGHHAGGGAAKWAADTHLTADPPLGRPKRATFVPVLTPGAKSPWQQLKNAPPFYPGTMLLASDGTVLVHNEPPSGGSGTWYKLTPDSHGNYVDGTWSKLPPMPGGYDPLYFGSAILPDGQMIVEGGEYLGGTPTWSNKGAIYNPVTNKWRPVAPPEGWTSMGDAESDVLANGTYMLAQPCQNCLSSDPLFVENDALFNQSGLDWTNLPGTGKNDPNDEEGWTLLPNGNILTVDTWLTPSTEQFTPTSLSWSNSGDTVKSPVNSIANEIGPQVEMPGGNTLVIGAGNGPEAPAACTSHQPDPTALFNYSAGKWVNGPTIPTIGGMQYDAADGPGSVLPDGNVLFDVSPCVYNTPIEFFMYDASTHKMVPVPNVPTAAQDTSYNTRLLVLPNGQILFGDGTHQMQVYTAGGTPNPAWAPSLTGISSFSFSPGQTASLSGIQLAGQDQGSAYGDDVQDATNYPIVRITNSKTGVVTYARTSDWTSVSVAPGAASSTKFTIPASAPAGPSSLVVIANGIASSPLPVTIK